MSEKILFVDDDPNLLAGMQRNLRRKFVVDLAESGSAGLARIVKDGPYAVVISDRQMPQMDGITFLTQARQQSPDSVRIMLTGNVNLDHAVQVVNQGNIFRFLIKPCAPEVLVKAIEDALTQYRLVTAERELLNNTLSGSVKLLTDILSSVDAESFGRAQQVRSLVLQVLPQFQAENEWEINVAAMLAPIGVVTVPPETVLRSRACKPLSKIEEQLLAGLPEIAAKLLGNIPRLGGVARIVHYHQKRFDGTGFPPDPLKGRELPWGARLLKILVDLQELLALGKLHLAGLNEMQARQGWYDPELLAAVHDCFAGASGGSAKVRPAVTVLVAQLRVGMTLRSDVLTKDGTLVVKTGHEINDTILEKIQNFESVSGIQEPIFAELP